MQDNPTYSDDTEAQESHSSTEETATQDALELLAHRLAAQFTQAKRTTGKPILLSQLRQHEQLISEAYRQFNDEAQEELPHSYASEWLMDNYFIVQQAIRQVREDMPPGYYRELPKLKTPPWESLPRNYALAREIIDYSGYQMAIEPIIRFLKAFQADVPLTMGELWAFPTMLRLGILSSLANALVALTRVESALVASATPLLAGDNTVRFCISSLRLLAVLDWKDFFEQVSHVEQILRHDPANVYAAMDFVTRNTYRTRVERLAHLTKHAEEDIARQAIAFSQVAASSSREAHVGHFLIGEGKSQLERWSGYHRSGKHALRRWVFSHATQSYFTGMALVTLLLMLLFGRYVASTDDSWLQILGIGLLTFLPATAIASSIVNWVVTLKVAPRLLPRLDFREGIPAEFKTMVVIPTLLTDVAEIDSLLQQLELHYLRNVDASLSFALLTDYEDAQSEHMPTDEGLISRVEAGIIALNVKYRPDTPPFFLFHRVRQWNEAQGSWIGWERKRGKLMEFNHLLRGDETTSYSVQLGDLRILPDIKYVITLDADTILPDGGAQRLVATLAHPLNRAIYDAQTGKVVSGYSILQPRIEIKPASANLTRFTAIYAGDTGLDLYTHAVSDVYQDLFGEGSYVGKGIYDVDLLEACLVNRIPENSLLSHDLFEGIHARVALVSDIMLLEEYPAGYLSHARRLHRWIRGDWQLLPWLLPKVPTGKPGETLPNPFSLLDRWKILDNLRRSLVTLALFLLLSAAWLGLIGSVRVWSLVAIGTLGFPLFLSLTSGLSRRSRTESAGEVLRSRRLDALRWLLALVFLPYEAMLVLTAITTTLERLIFTRKGMLQWTTAAQSARLFRSDRGSVSTWREMIRVPLLSSILAILVVLMNPGAIVFAFPILALWFISPEIAYRISLPNSNLEPALTVDQEVGLRHLARQTWLFFEQTVGPEDHWLPVDHFQESPHIVAHRTSPTNIGLLLTSTLAAHDLGYIGHIDLITRLQMTFEAIGQMEHYRGHLLNWYDTVSLAPLAPRYVSTVDSGNLAGCLMVVKQACLALPDTHVIRQQRWQGLIDTLGLLEASLDGLYKSRQDAPVTALRAFVIGLHEQIQSVIQLPEQWAALIARLNRESWEEISHLIVAVFESETASPNATTLHAVRITTERLRHHLANMQRDMDVLLPWILPVSKPPFLFVQSDGDPLISDAWRDLLAALPKSPHLSELNGLCDVISARLAILQGRLQGGKVQPDEAAIAWCSGLADRLKLAQAQVKTLIAGYQMLAADSEARFQAMDFGFLYNPLRKVFRIGYNVSNDKLDENYYDLLASEARLTSFLAIAKREVPPDHWMHLGRPAARVNNNLTLLSWSGTMFEYLMPTLFVQGYENTFLTQSCRAAVDNQIAYGRSKSVPWGISESSYYAFDSSMTYQYHAFGVPDMGFKRDLAEDLVIAPYASLLALGLRPQAVVQNMEQLDAIHMRGLYGFYEAVDYTPSRMPLRQNHAIIRSYMAHHQGMILMSLVNYLQNESMIERFHADPRVQSFALLLQERIPTQIPIEDPHPADSVVRVKLPAQQVNIAPWNVPDDTTVPQVHTLSNGRLSTLITNAGGGYSRWQGVSLTRWEADSTLDASGNWIYLQDQVSGDLWSAGYQPTAVPREYQHVSYYPHLVEYQRRDHDITVNMQITIAADDDVEIRRINLINHGDQARRIRVTSYGEVLLAPQAERHPAFNKLFIESEYLPEHNLLLFHRRPRSADDELISMGHLLITSGGLKTTGAYDGDRMPFLGRGRSLRSPAVFDPGADLTKTVGKTLDPIMALGQDVALEPYGRVTVAYLTLVGRSRAEVVALAERYRDWVVVERAVELARRQSELVLRQLELDSPELARIQQMLSLLLYPHASMRAAADTIAANTRGQSGLWAYGVSGDAPILLLRVSNVSELPLVLEVLRAHTYWRDQQISIELVLLNIWDSSYSQELHEQLHRLVARANSSSWLNRRGGIFMVNADQMSPADRVLMETAARVILDGQRGSLAEQLPQLSVRRVWLPLHIPSPSNPEMTEATPPLIRPADLQFDNGLGGFSADGREYVIYLEAGQSTPAPWVNVIANEQFGFLVSESGGGFTWAENSSENRLTPWRNDPVADAPGEALYLRDEETSRVWSPMPLPGRDAEPYLVRHGAGYSQFEHHSLGLKQTTRLFTAPDAPVKIIKLHLENTWNRPRRLTVTYYAEWVLGVSRTVNQAYIIPEYDHTSGALLARNPYNSEFGERVAFLAAGKAPHGLTTDRTEFLGRLGDFRRPAALSRIGLASTVEAGRDPCAALQLHVELPVGASEEVFFILGQGSQREHAIQLVQTYQDAAQVQAAWQGVSTFWDQILGTVSVKTPDPAMDLMLNRWLLYQALSCRIWGRSGFYQSSGAFGFRDQLQDVMALLLAAPQIAREHILRAAGHQFEAGDVLHWWHPPFSRGVRTRCSDDLLWLPFVVAQYVDVTGDTAILDARIPFLRAEPLKPDEEERYGRYEMTPESYTLYEHCLRAIKRGSTAGAHGLPLMGTGDWNDGMNRVGIEGRGESVWLGWFLVSVLQNFAPLCMLKAEPEQAQAYAGQAERLKAALEAGGWDGQWYRRAYYDDGTPLGSSQNTECQIDAIAQSWAVLSGAGDAARSAQAMSAVADRLYQREEQLVLLFTPPFDRTAHDPGYIKGYPPGIRENGGQYTHAALWTTWAFARLGQGNLAGELFRSLNPILHSDSPEKVEKYRVDPYVIAADVYSVAPHIGRGGWTWYTGSASWMVRLGIEAILGLKRKGDRLEIDPCIPENWPGYQLRYRDGETVYDIHVHNPHGVSRGVVGLTLDGVAIDADQLLLQNDGMRHDIRIELGRSNAQ